MHRSMMNMNRRIPFCQRVLLIFVACLMVPGTGWMISATEDGPAAPRGRGGDLEPNDLANANLIDIGEVVNGSLRIDPDPDDYVDWFMLTTPVPYGKIFCATLYMIDHDPAIPYRIDFNLGAYRTYDGNLTTIEEISTTNRSETTYWLQNWNNEPETIWLCIWTNYSHHNYSDPGNYRLTTSLLDMPKVTGARVAGYLSYEAGPKYAYYNLSGPEDDKGMRLRLQTAPGPTVYMQTYTEWDLMKYWWMQNCTYTDPATGYGEVDLVGVGGQYYVYFYTYSGQGGYTLTVEDSGGPLDDNNFPSNATLVTKSSINYAFLAGGVDSVDWWKVNMTKDVPLIDVKLKVVENEFYGWPGLWIFDQNISYLGSMAPIVTNYTGPLYFAVMTWSNYSGWYKLGFQFPNGPPRLKAGVSNIPTVTMDQGTTDSSVLLSDYIDDPDGDDLNYTLRASKYHTMPSVDRKTGRVTLAPAPDWWGRENITVQAQDDGPYQCMTNFSMQVVVNPVEHAPTAFALADAIIAEGTAWQSPDLATLFSDIDDSIANLSFGCRVISSDTHPAGAQLPIRIDSYNRVITAGPAPMVWGNYTIQLNCTDDGPETVPACTQFNLSVYHVNHPPQLAKNISDPLQFAVKEHVADYEVALDPLFTDPDMLPGYCTDGLSYAVSGMRKLSAVVGPGNRLVIDARKEELAPGTTVPETLRVTAMDRAGMTVALDLVITLEPVDDPPVIMAYQPVDDMVTLKEGQKKAFSVTVTDVDTPGKNLAYVWYLDGAKDTRAKDVTYTLETDPSMRGAVHRVRVEVSDGTTTASRQWEVRLTKVNRLPEGSIISPLNMSTFVQGAAMNFAAQGSDPDGDNLTYIWKDLAGKELGRGANFTMSAAGKGTLTVRLEISDGQGSVLRDVTIAIKAKAQEPKRSPGFGAAALLAGAGASGLAAAFRRRTPGSEKSARGKRLPARPRNRTGTTIFALFVLCLLLQGAAWADSPSEHVQTVKAGRGGDLEPNNESGDSSPIGENEATDGSLLVSSEFDYVDYYKLEGGLPYCKLMCVTLYYIDYDTNDPGRYKFNLSVYQYEVSSTYLLKAFQLQNRSLTFVYFQDVSNNPIDIYFEVMVNFSIDENYNYTITTQPGRYRLSVSVYDPPLYSGPEANGYLNTDFGPGMIVYNYTGLAVDAGARVRIEFPRPNIFYLAVFNIWQLTGYWWCQNCSLVDTPNGFQDVSIVGIGGTYYIFITAAKGSGAYKLTTPSAAGPGDDDNSPAKATPISEVSAKIGNVSSGKDSMDWWRINLRADVPVKSLSAKWAGGAGFLNFILFDEKVRSLGWGTFDAGNTSKAFTDLSVSYTGPVYLLVCAGYVGIEANIATASYELTVQLPNEGPRLNGSIPGVVMDEDTSYDGLVLSDYFIDPEGNKLAYSLAPGDRNCRPVMNRDTGRVNFTPTLHWSGQEVIIFSVKDDGPTPLVFQGSFSVTVLPVNDFPKTGSFLTDTSIKEDAQWQTPDLTTLFSDVDDAPANLSFGCRVVSSDTRPPGTILPVRQDLPGHKFTLGPIHLAYGTYEVELNCTDNRPASVPASMRFNLTVGHVNHDPQIAPGVSEPLGVTIKEHAANTTIALDDLFTDADLAPGYGDDRLTYSVAGMKRLAARVDTGKRNLVVDVQNIEYTPGTPEWENLVVTAKDKAGQAATLNITVTVEPENDPPVVTGFFPPDEQTTVKEGQKTVYTVIAADPDTDERALTYAWYVDNARAMQGKNSSFSFEPDFSMGGATLEIRAEVSDGTNNVSKVWRAAVTDVNRLPDGRVKGPAALARFLKGAEVAFTAEGSDPDGDNLTFIWRDANGNEIGRGASFATKGLKKGTQTIRLEINDSKGGVQREVSIEVYEKAEAKKSPGFGTVALLVAATTASAILAVRKRRPGDT